MDLGLEFKKPKGGLGKIADLLFPDDGRYKQQPKEKHKGDWGKHSDREIPDRKIKTPKTPKQGASGYEAVYNPEIRMWVMNPHVALDYGQDAVYFSDDPGATPSAEDGDYTIEYWESTDALSQYSPEDGQSDGWLSDDE